RNPDLLEVGLDDLSPALQPRHARKGQQSQADWLAILLKHPASALRPAGLRKQIFGFGRVVGETGDPIIPAGHPQWERAWVARGIPAERCLDQRIRVDRLADRLAHVWAGRQRLL